ncbi:MAG: MHS family MFS transporter [Thermorudis peleae]|nr:MHS family MFS transporter [Thermorudis peleae]
MAEAGFALPAEEYARQLRRAAIASVIGTTIEWYDFFLYGTMAALIFPKLLFPKEDPYVALLQSFATYAVGFVARPIGGALFGHFGDRLGRKATLITTLLLMGIGTAVIGLLPPYSVIGIWAAVLATLMRILQGLGVGGEWGGAILLAMEWSKREQRGFITSLPQLGVPFGLILSSLVTTLFINISGNGFESWGWRVPFLLSLILVAIGLYVRLTVFETPLFQQALERGELARAPLVEVFRTHLGPMIWSMLARVVENGGYYIISTFLIAYGTTFLKLDRSLLVNATIPGALAGIVGVFIGGYLADRIGRKRVYLVATVLMALYAFPYYALLNTKQPSMIVLAVMIGLFIWGLLYGPQAAFIAENFPTRVRYSGASLGYQLTAIIAGGPAPYISTALLSRYKNSTPLSLYIILMAVVSFIGAFFLHDRTGEELG